VLQTRAPELWTSLFANTANTLAYMRIYGLSAAATLIIGCRSRGSLAEHASGSPGVQRCDTPPELAVGKGERLNRVFAFGCCTMSELCADAEVGGIP
jgi:hypothetical protein